MDRSLNYLAIARKAGLVELGEEPVGAAARALHARLIAVAKDASDHTWRRAKSFAAGTDQQCVRTPFTKDEMGFAVGRQELSLAAFTDPALALEFAKAMPGCDSAVVEALQVKADRVKQHRKEAASHARNVRTGKSRRGTDTKKD